MPASSGLRPSSTAWLPSPWPTCSTSGPSASLPCGQASCCPSPRPSSCTTASCCTSAPPRSRRWSPTPWCWPPCCGAAWPGAGAPAGGPCSSRSRIRCWPGTPSSSPCPTPAWWS